MKDLVISLLVGTVLGLGALMAMLSFGYPIPALVAIAFGLLGAMTVSLFRLGPGIRHLITGMERDRVEIAKATEELKKLMSRIREPSEVEIEMYGGQRFIPPFEARDRSSQVRKEP
jgi:xanthosine utilization system XapX-like protein